MLGKPQMYHDDRTSVGGITKHDYQSKSIGKSKKPVNKVGVEHEYETEM